MPKKSHSKLAKGSVGEQATQSWFVPDSWDWVRPLRRRIALKILLFACVPILCLTLFDLWQLRKGAIAVAENHLFQLAQGERAVLAKTLEDRRTMMQRLFRNESVHNDLANWLKSPDEDKEAEMRLSIVARSYVEEGWLNRMLFIGADGRALIAAEKTSLSPDGKGQVSVKMSRSGLGQNFSREKFFQETIRRQSLYIQDISYSEAREQHEMHFCVPVWAPPLDEPPSHDRKLLGIWAGVINPDEQIFPLLRLWPWPGQTGEVFLYREEADKMRFISPTRHRPAATLRVEIPLPLAHRKPLDLPIWESDSAFSFMDYRGKEVVAVSLPVLQLREDAAPAPLRWFLVAKQDRDEILADLREQEARTLLMMALAIIGVGVLAYSVEKRLAAKRLAVAYHYATSLINSVSSVIYAVDKSYRIKHVNQPLNAFRRSNGNPLWGDKVIGKNILDTVATPQLRTLYQEALEDVFQGRRPSFAHETAFGAADNPTYWFTTISPLIVDKKIEGAVVALSDITDRVKMEAQVEKDNHQLQLLYNVNSAITETVETDLILQRLAFGACRAVEAPQALFMRFDRQTNELVGAVATDPTITDFNQVRYRGNDTSLMWQATQERRSLISQDIQRDSRANLRVARKVRAKSGVAVPLLFRSTTIGCLLVYETERLRHFTQEEVERLEKIARQAAIAIQHADLMKSYKESRDRLQYLMDNIRQIIFQMDAKGQITFLNRAFEKVFSLPVSDWLGRSFEDWVVPSDLGKARQAFQTTLAGRNTSVEVVAKATGGDRLLALTMSPTTDSDGNIVGAQGLASDITEQRQYQQQILQAQKMDSLGVLAGGVAHDFNNMLTALSGHCALMLSECTPNHPWYHQLLTMETGIQRMSELTRQLLTFGRKSSAKLEPVDINKIVDEVVLIFQRTLGSNVRLEIVTTNNLPPVEADSAQISQVLMNLILNARDAMPDGGRLRIETSTVHLDNNSVQKYPGLKPGSHIRLAVNDSGRGIPPELINRIFEPFFTTKESGKGLGLGLSVVYGIVQYHKGHISCTSRPGDTTFEILLPARTGGSVAVALPHPLEPEGGTETILFIDDEEILLDLGKRILEGYGYKVHAMRDAQGAVEYYRTHQDEIALVISDVVMPKMNARELFVQLRLINPNVKVLLTSGYSADGFVQSIIQMGAVGFLQKPYRIKEFARIVKEAIQSRSPSLI